MRPLVRCICQTTPEKIMPEKLAPLPYILRLPDKSLVRFGDIHYRVDENNPLSAGYVNELGERIVQLKPLPEDPFPEGAVAEFPLRMSYVKTGNIWLPVAPSPVARPVFLAEQVYGHTGYWVVERKPYRGRERFDRPLIIPFNVSMSLAKEDGFFGEELALRYASNGTVKEEIRIIIDLPVMGSEAQLVFSTQANATTTKDSLAKKIALEVEKAFNVSSVLFVAFMDGRLRKEVRFEDMFLVELVQKSGEDFQATIAIAVDPSEDAWEGGND